MSRGLRDRPLLHLTATDTDDLSVISAQMQDSAIRFGDIKYLSRQRRFAMVANRFAWDALPEKQRRRTGLVFNDVTGARRTGPRSLNPDTILSLLSATFQAVGEEMSGVLTITFAGGHAFALDVACIDAQLDDLGPAWSTEKTPGHGDQP